MLKSAEWQETMLVHPVQGCGPIPSVEDPDGIYPYPSFCETASRPQLRQLRMISIENDRLKVTVCPDLGGKVHSIFDKASGKEVLFDSGTVRPVRILPRMAFISGGIEVSFPIAHTPVQLEAVHASVERIGDRLYVWCGEREIRYGMHWTVEYSLGEDDRFLTQRTLFVNPGSGTHAWMSWSNAALPARPDSLFHFPSGRVLRHADVLEEITWEREREYRLSDFDRMQGFFWRSADCNAFGMFTPSLGSGLYHIADPAETPGIKLWLYGLGRHEEWAWATAAQLESYAEIQAGPLLEQADNNTLAPGERHMHTEFWIPSGEPLDIAALRLPQPELSAEERIPLFGWAPRESSAVWLRLEEAYAAAAAAALPPLPTAPPIEEINWPPSGMERLGDALQWAERLVDESGNENERLLWRYYYGVWLAGRGELEAAIGVLETVDADWSFALLGRLYRSVRGDYEASLAAYRRIRSAAWSLHPQVFAERDMTLSFFGAAAFAERASWFERVASLQDDALLERRAHFLFEKGDVLEAKALLERTPFEKVHQRYARSELWRRIAAALSDADAPGGADAAASGTATIAGAATTAGTATAAGAATPVTAAAAVPAHLGEDDLAVYGAYRVTDAKQAHE